MILVEFKKKFRKGNFVGMTYEDKISFPNIKSALEWVEGIRTNLDLDYWIEDVEYVLIKNNNITK